jgi:hypothetical protein
LAVRARQDLMTFMGHEAPKHKSITISSSSDIGVTSLFSVVAPYYTTAPPFVKRFFFHLLCGKKGA